MVPIIILFDSFCVNANGERVYFTFKILFPRSDSVERVTLDIPLDLRYLISTMKWINFKWRGS